MKEDGQRAALRLRARLFALWRFSLNFLRETTMSMRYLSRCVATFHRTALAPLSLQTEAR
ncbi:hypothetical protein [Xanthomonas hydrangeae]|uniref:hypothetical protein n=1 Tax=Xanthomonas hydrangeae TaxID=2775159 RepID=UPI0019624064